MQGNLIPGPLVLLDRDGTIIVEKHYLHEPDKVELLPNAAKGLKAMLDAGWRLAVVSNQSGVGRGYFPVEDVDSVNQRMAELLSEHGVEIHGYFFCPHAPEEDCDCRKPKPGLALQATQVLGADPEKCVVIGDKPCDVNLGKAVGARTMLVSTGYGSDPAIQAECNPDHMVDDLLEAAQLL